ncbi:AbiH family protein [Clostridium saudiense]|uniref:AbiH family protein n=1 Tax=Clostridium saudiense TaxID=1414720 RepID=UPI0026735079|nr:AbiH family protein [Clostridium saudiense]
MNILVIGNGFDLTHGLPTKYWDFLMFIKCIKEHDSLYEIEKTSEFENLNNEIKNLIYNQAYRTSDNDNELLEFIKLIENNVWINYFIDKIQDKDKNKGWIDFELEISQVIKSLDYLQNYNKRCFKNPSNSKLEDTELYEEAWEFLEKMKNKNIIDNDSKLNGDEFYDNTAKQIIDELNNQLNNLIRCLEIYLEEFVGKIKINYTSPDIFDISQMDKGIDKVLSFNYTKTYENEYDLTKGRVKYDYIHGKAYAKRKKEENNMVLGIDEYLENDKKDKELDFIQFKKYFQRIYKKTGCEYRKWIEEIKNEYDEFQRTQSLYEDLKNLDDGVDNMSLGAKDILENKGEEHNIYIFGHSLDVTDKDILKELIMLPRTTTTIYYYNDEAYKQYIVNLVKLIGQDELTDRVHGLNPKINFKKQR